jgi:nicotinate-nucleotide adenylyltransferase
LAPPHKKEQEISAFSARAEMVRLALAGEEKMDVCLVEESLPPPSYTIKTLRALSAGRLAGCELFFVIGSDSLFDLLTWHDYEEILATVHLLVAARQGDAGADVAGMAQRLGYAIDGDPIAGDRWHCPGKKDIFFLPGYVPAVSSTALRAALKRGEECPLLPPAVAAWLRERRLYEK